MQRVRRIGHPARLCSSEGWVNDLEQDVPEGENINEEGTGLKRTTRHSKWSSLEAILV